MQQINLISLRSLRSHDTVKTDQVPKVPSDHCLQGIGCACSITRDHWIRSHYALYASISWVQPISYDSKREILCCKDAT